MARRPYHSPRRAQDAASTRRDILRTAADLFATNGYGRVTVAEIAKQAGVAPQTVYSSAGSKSDILREIVSEAVGSSGADTTVEAIRRTEDLATAIGLVAHGTRMAKETQRQAIDILFAAMPVHEDAGQLWRQSTTAYRHALGEVAEHLRDKGLLPAGAEIERVTDVLWFWFGFNSWRTLVDECGWGMDDAEHWLAARAIESLAAPDI
ncbi:TetR/AcrR family transcriptional regulator [Amycolatopsis sp. CA-230715]|uniref:TetR/AcrR family transcriptional regulator n=1 Tax=Amycolatopsis sp. CA-230715 TaxID=2745196 RepID=UPI001C0306CE|nr:TetR family transcriptional regulator [Amycolatopsis sp. CA-230715]QWF79734.1 hypothetical protein HUW46_03146 [Amycolatopsis sp. CA-230715]